MRNQSGHIKKETESVMRLRRHRPRLRRNNDSAQVNRSEDAKVTLLVLENVTNGTRESSAAAELFGDVYMLLRYKVCTVGGKIKERKSLEMFVAAS